MDMGSYQRLAGAHRVEIIEGGRVASDDSMPGYYTIECKCGWRSKSYHGRGHADELAQRHLFAKLHEIELTPGGANRR